MNKLTIEYIKQKTKELAKGYECLSEEYTNNHTKLEFRCSIGHIYKATWANFSRGRRCPKCAKKINIERITKNKLSLEFIIKETQRLSDGHECLAKEYVNCETKMPFRCPIGHVYYKTWSKFKIGQRCKKCWIESISSKNCHLWKGGVTKRKETLYNTYAPQIDWCEEVRRDTKNPELLQVRCTESSCRKWFNPTKQEIDDRIRFINGKISNEGRFYCSKKCKNTCSLFNQRKYPKGFIPDDYIRKDQKEWANMIKERDNYVCQKCGEYCDNNCIAHHIEGLNLNPIMSADIDIGITLCKKCDKEVHSEKGCRYIDLTKNSLCLG